MLWDGCLGYVGGKLESKQGNLPNSNTFSEPSSADCTFFPRVTLYSHLALLRNAPPRACDPNPRRRTSSRGRHACLFAKAWQKPMNSPDKRLDPILGSVRVRIPGKFCLVCSHNTHNPDQGHKLH